MKLRYWAISLFIIFSTSLFVTNVKAQEEGPDLVPTGLTWERRTTEAGEQVFLTVEVTNEGTAVVTSELVPSVSLTHVQLSDGTAVDVPVCTEAVVALVGLAPGTAVSHTFACPFPGETPGDYLITVVVDSGKAVTETTEGENNNTRALVPAAAAESSLLPESVSRLFAGLGLFAAIMAVLAVGTEVTVDSLRLLLGLKRKPTSLEALEKLEDMLPGKLEALGAGAAAEQELKKYVGAMRDTLKPVENAQNIWLTAQSGQIIDAAKAVFEWWDENDPQKRPLLKAKIDEKFNQGLQGLQARLNLSDEMVQKLGQDIRYWVNEISIDDFDAILNKAVELVQSQSSQIIADWLRSQAASLAKQGKGYVIAQFEDVVIPELASLLGKQNDDQIFQDLQAKLSEGLDQLDARALDNLDSYIESLENLMTAVEERRNVMQSPFRKLWRRLRSMRVVGQLFVWVEQLMNFVLGRDANPNTFGEAQTVPKLSSQTAAYYLMRTNDQQRDEEASRLRWLRFISVIVGIVLGYLLGIDAAGLLDHALPGVANTINDAFTIKAVHLQNFFAFLPVDASTLADVLKRDLTAGIILSGLAASAGSAFWHDQLDKLQAAKKSAEQAASMAQSVRNLTGNQEDK